MRSFAMIGAFVLAAVTSVLAQETREKAQEPQPQKEHEWLKQFEGDWDVRMKWMMPGEAAEESTGSDSSRVAFKGFWLMSDHKGEFGKKPFEGHSMMGFDPALGKFVSVCIGDNAPHLTKFKGTADADGKKFTFDGECVDPKTGKKVTQKVICEVMDKDHYSDKIYVIGDDGKETLIGECTHTRKGKTEAK